MKNTILLLSLILFFTTNAIAGKITGVISDDKGNPLPYASITIKEKNTGTTANQQGYYSLELNAGEYTLVIQYVGFAKLEQKIHVDNTDKRVDFTLHPSQLQLKDVVISSNREDPAYAIIRQAIKKRDEYRDALDSFTCEAYIKTLIKTRSLPRKIFGQKIDSADWKQMGVDSAGKGIIYLSESLTRIAYKKPDKVKLEVISGRESGSSGYGFSFPTFINFYNNNVQVFGGEIAPRGYVCPIADAAFNFYKFHFLGSFFEDGREINRIQVIPRRKYEPLFSGTIEITEGDWRIYSVDLMLTKESQLELLDTLQIKQIHFPVTKDIWRTKDQVVYFTFNIFGIDAVGNFLNVYNNYDVTPSFKKKYFNNIVVKFDTAVNKKTAAYWDSVRPVPLEQEEIKDYHVKDSVFHYRNDSSHTKHYQDSLRRMQGKISVMNILWNGFTRSNYDPANYNSVEWQPLLKGIEYNTVEGLALNAEASFNHGFLPQKRELSFTPQHIPLALFDKMPPIIAVLIDEGSGPIFDWYFFNV